MAEKRAYNLGSGSSEAVTVSVQFEVSSLSGQVSDSDSGSENNSI